ncbi:MAG TPA: endonuclease/exonuclease/phosphatase family protein [Acidimicrobiia bacterium]|nr:endonuclease/exonuclease/phosphatase family protein [Acidimicrobiia bacterium]
MPSASASESARDFTVAAYNAHWGIGRFGRAQGVRFDVARVVRSFDADIVVVPESWRDADGVGVLDSLRDDGYHVESLELMRLELRRRRRTSDRHGVPYAGAWEIAICTRFPVLDRRLITMGTVRNDAPGERSALGLTLAIDDTPVDMVGLHVSSKVWKLAPLQHLLTLRRGLAVSGPQIVAGDFNFWGPGVAAAMRGWQRPVRGRTYPARRPHSQIDHVLVRGGIEALGGEVLAETPSDHRPIRTRLRLMGGVT